MRKHIVIVSPALASENNGNWQTANRWASFLQDVHEVTIRNSWNSGDQAPDLMVVLHAQRSASSLAAFSAAFPERPSVLVLTGTDLYRDIDNSPQAQVSLRRAAALVVLQEAALLRVPEIYRSKTHVVYQSAPAFFSGHRPDEESQHEVCMIGHLRDEKDPLTFIRAAALLAAPSAQLLHIGGALDPALGSAAQSAMDSNPRYRWLGPLPHAETRQRLEHCHAMVIASKMEGGANVIIEAVTSGVPVLASHIDGNVGMLGADYAGYFPLGDAAALARLIDRSILEPDFLALLRRQCADRAPLFAPETERAAVRDLVDNLLRQERLT